MPTPYQNESPESKQIKENRKYLNQTDTTMTALNLTKLTELLDSALTELNRIRTELNDNVQPTRLCGNCKHEDKLLDESPCNECFRAIPDISDKFEPKQPEPTEVRPTIDNPNNIDKVQPDEPIEPEPVICGYTRTELNEMLKEVEKINCSDCKHYMLAATEYPCANCVVYCCSGSQFHFQPK